MLFALYDRGVLPSLVLQAVVLLLMLDLNPALRLADLAMMDQEDLVMMHLEDLAMMDQEVLVTMFPEGLVMKVRRDLVVMMHREEGLVTMHREALMHREEGHLMMDREDQLLMMHPPELARVLMDRCHPETMFLMVLQHHLHDLEVVDMRQPLVAGTLLGDD